MDKIALTDKDKQEQTNKRAAFASISGENLYTRNNSGFLYYSRATF